MPDLREPLDQLELVDNLSAFVGDGLLGTVMNQSSSLLYVELSDVLLELRRVRTRLEGDLRSC
jgi:hypothetical protein